MFSCLWSFEQVRRISRRRPEPRGGRTSKSWDHPNHSPTRAVEVAGRHRVVVPSRSVVCGSGHRAGTEGSRKMKDAQKQSCHCTSYPTQRWDKQGQWRVRQCAWKSEAGGLLWVCDQLCYLTNTKTARNIWQDLIWKRKKKEREKERAGHMGPPFLEWFLVWFGLYI